MWLILVWCGCAVAIIAERAVFMVRSSIDKDLLLSRVRWLVVDGDVCRAIKLCCATEAPLARVVKAGLMKVNRTNAEVQAAMDGAARRETAVIDRRTPYLVVVANLAMLSGLLGTVTGLVRSYCCFGCDVDPTARSTLLAKGVGEAMNCTAFGLAVAIMALLGFALLNGKTQGMHDDIKEANAQVLNLVVGNRAKLSLWALPAAEAPLTAL